MATYNQSGKYGATTGEVTSDVAMQQTGDHCAALYRESGVAGGDVRPVTYTHAGQSARGDGVKS